MHSMCIAYFWKMIKYVIIPWSRVITCLVLSLHNFPFLTQSYFVKPQYLSHWSSFHTISVIVMFVYCMILGFGLGKPSQFSVLCCTHGWMNFANFNRQDMFMLLILANKGTVLTQVYEDGGCCHTWSLYSLPLAKGSLTHTTAEIPRQKWCIG